MSEVDVEDTIIKVQLPLPMDVASSIMNAFGHLWPNGGIDTTASNHGYLTMRIPHDDRCRTKRVATKIRADKTYLESAIEAEVRGFDKDGSLRATATEYIARSIGAAARAMFEDNPEAVNYMEMTVHNPESGNSYVITAAKSDGQTPSALYKKSLERIAELEAQLEAK